MNVVSSKCWAFLEEIPDSFLVDVRSDSEWKEFGIPDLTQINKEVFLLPLIFFEPFMHKNDNFLISFEQRFFLNKNSHIFLICKSGKRSMTAAEILLKQGYHNIYNVSDGFLGNDIKENHLGWKKNQLPWRIYA